MAEQLKGSDVLTCCVVGFPLGAMLTSAKAGAQEVDMVINIGAVKDQNYALEKKDFYTGKVPKNAVKWTFFGTFWCLGGV